MKQIIIAAVCTFSFCTALSQTKKTVESKIEKVTVFMQGAQVERSAAEMLLPGKYELVFAGVSPLIDKQSIQVKATGNVVVQSVIFQINYLKTPTPVDEIKVLESKKEDLNDKIEAQQNNLIIYRKEEEMLKQNQQIGGNTGIKTIELKEATDFQRIRLTELYQKITEANKTIKKLNTELAKINNQMNELNKGKDKTSNEIVVSLNVKEAVKSNFVITYVVKSASWYPTYDIRVKDINSPLQIQYKANVMQNSGEEWKDVKLILSTGNPNENSNKPELIPWFLKYGIAYKQIQNNNQIAYSNNSISGKVIDNRGNPVVGASVIIKGSRTGTSTDANGLFNINAMPNSALVITGVGYDSQEILANNGFYNITLEESKQMLNEVVVVGYGSRREGEVDDESFYNKKEEKKKLKPTGMDVNITYQPTTMTYEIKEPYTIINDGKTHTVDIDGYEVKTMYEYFAIPKLNAEAYLTAKITDWQELNLLPGEANIYFEGTYLGKSMLDVLSAGDTLNLSLGKDKGVVVKRTLMKEFSSKKFFGSNKTDTREYEIVVRNNKQQSIVIIIQDQFPISTQKDIEVSEKKYEGGQLDEEKQIVTWQIKLNTKEENKIRFKYQIKYPKDKQLFID